MIVHESDKRGHEEELWQSDTLYFSERKVDSQKNGTQEEKPGTWEIYGRFVSELFVLVLVDQSQHYGCIFGRSIFFYSFYSRYFSLDGALISCEDGIRVSCLLTYRLNLFYFEGRFSFMKASAEGEFFEIIFVHGG